jgi:hypothetical protein
MRVTFEFDDTIRSEKYICSRAKTLLFTPWN